ncbi:alkaline phosphatase family protein [soil metagenome]
MLASPDGILLIFLDGVGIGDGEPAANPFVTAQLPHLRALLGGRLPILSDLDPSGQIVAGRALLVRADATLGISGMPQSGTGQTALLTGRNAPALFGRHFGPWVPTGLRAMLGEESLLARAAGAGRRVAYANAFPLAIGVERRPIAFTYAAHAAGLLVRDATELRAGEAVASSITHHLWRSHLGTGFPDTTPEDAGRALARIAAQAELTVFAHYDTDTAGHRGELAGGVAALEKVDRFLGAVLAALPEDILLVVASDHGNLEDATRGHTRNPVPVIAAGPGRERVAERVRALTDVAPALLSLLGID